MPESKLTSYCPKNWKYSVLEWERCIAVPVADDVGYDAHVHDTTLRQVLFKQCTKRNGLKQKHNLYLQCMIQENPGIKRQ